MPKPARTTVLVSLKGRYAMEIRGWKLPLYALRKLCGRPSWLAVTYLVHGRGVLVPGSTVTFRLQALNDCWKATFDAVMFWLVRYPANALGTTIELFRWSKLARFPPSSMKP